MFREKFPVPDEWANRAWADDAKYQEMYKRSIHDPEAGLEYAQRLAPLRQHVREGLPDMEHVVPHLELNVDARGLQPFRVVAPPVLAHVRVARPLQSFLEGRVVLGRVLRREGVQTHVQGRDVIS